MRTYAAYRQHTSVLALDTSSSAVPARRNVSDQEHTSKTNGTVSHSFAGMRIHDQEDDSFQLQWPGIQREPMFQLQLDPEIEAEIAAMRRIRQLITLETVESALPRLDLSTFLASQPPPWLTMPTPEPEPPLVPRGAGPEEPRAASTGDVMKAIMRIPAVNSALTRVRTEAMSRVRNEWQSLSTGEQALVIGHSAVVGGTALAGVLSSPEASTFILNQIQNRTLPVPGVPGLTFQFNATGPEQRIYFDLNVGQFLPASLGFR